MEFDAALILARWVYYGTAMVLFGSLLLPVYASPTPEAALPRAVATTLAFAMLGAAIMWLLCFSATLGDTEDAVERCELSCSRTASVRPWLARLSGAGLALVAVLARRPRLVVAATLIALTCEGWSGHAAAWSFTGSLVQAAHVVCVGAWIGGLVSLALLVVRARKTSRLSQARPRRGGEGGRALRCVQADAWPARVRRASCGESSGCAPAAASCPRETRAGMRTR